MAFRIPELPYATDALAPHISRETLEYHHGKHHVTYVKNLNQLVAADRALAGKSLHDLIAGANGPVFNNAAQAYNHDFYWHSLSPPASSGGSGGGEPRGVIAEAIRAAFGSFADFKEQFSETAVGHFASGWAWLVKDGARLAIVDTHDADCPLREGKTPVLTCDVWEHAYYIDYRNDRSRYLAAYWNVVNWDFANKNFSG